MQCVRRELGVPRPVPAGFYHRLRIVGSIVVLIHGGSLLADHTCGQGGDTYRAGAPAGRRVRCCLPANGTNLRPASVIRLHSAKCNRTISRRSDVTPAGTPRQHAALVRIKSGLAALRDFGPTNDRVGSCVTSAVLSIGGAQLYER